MNTVLFLDFDGPLFPDRVIRFSPPASEYPGKNLHKWVTYWQMDVTSVRQLNYLFDLYNFDTVISSSWGDLCSLEQIQELFDVNGLRLRIHQDWDIPHGGRFSANRAHRIKWWLDEHSVNGVYPNHLILDDPMSGSCLCDIYVMDKLGLSEAFIVDPDIGIDSHCFSAMEKKLEEYFIG